MKQLIMKGNIIHEHMTTNPMHVLLDNNGTLLSCSREDIKTFESTPARNALLDQMSCIKMGQTVLAVYVDNDFLSYVVTLGEIV